MSRRRMRIGSGLLIVAAGIAATGVMPTTAAASPTPSTDPMQQYKDLSTQAEKANEDLLTAQNDLATKQAQLRQASTQLAQAKQVQQQAQAQEGQVRGQLDQFAEASFEGVRLNQLSALLTGTSVQDYLDRANMLQHVAADNANALRKFQTATDQAGAAQQQAQSAQRRAQDAETAAAALVTTVTQRKQALQVQITQVKQALAKLTVSQRTSLNNVGDTRPVTVVASGVINTVIQAALSRRGDAYVWGAAGPAQFDCSGLTMWAYAHGGISLPHSSSAQYQLGTSVSYGQWQPGDLLFWGSSASTIHHVAMYVGNGEIVQAPTEGMPVQVVPISGGGSDYFGAKRIVG